MIAYSVHIQKFRALCAHNINTMSKVSVKVSQPPHFQAIFDCAEIIALHAHYLFSLLQREAKGMHNKMNFSVERYNTFQYDKNPDYSTNRPFLEIV